MKFIINEKLENIPLSPQANELAKYLNHNDYERLEKALVETYSNQPLPVTEIEYIFRNDKDWVAKLCFYDSFEELVKEKTALEYFDLDTGIEINYGFNSYPLIVFDNNFIENKKRIIADAEQNNSQETVDEIINCISTEIEELIYRELNEGFDTTKYMAKQIGLDAKIKNIADVVIDKCLFNLMYEQQHKEQENDDIEY